jgi:hypothetical protein
VRGVVCRGWSITGDQRPHANAQTTSCIVWSIGKRMKPVLLDSLSLTVPAALSTCVVAARKNLMRISCCR